MFQLPQPDGFLSAWDVKDVAADVIGELPLPEIEGRALDPGDIWSVVILASTNQSSVREVCAENHEAPFDDITLAMTYVRSDEKQADAVERVLLDRVEVYSFEIEVLLADSSFYNERVI